MNDLNSLQPLGRNKINIDQDAYIGSATSSFNFGGNLLLSVLLDKLDENQLIQQHKEVEASKDIYSLKISTNQLEGILCQLETQHTGWFVQSIDYVREQKRLEIEDLLLVVFQKVCWFF